MSRKGDKSLENYFTGNILLVYCIIDSHLMADDMRGKYNRQSFNSSPN
jgi:hypothetical protein